MTPSLTSPIIEVIVQQYQKDGANESVVTLVRQIRRQLAEFWLATPDEILSTTYLEDVGKAHHILANSGIKDEPLTESEKAFVQDLIAHISQGFSATNALQYLLAGWLYCRADQLPLQYQGAGIPKWLIDDLLRFMIQWPAYFQELGEVEKYYLYMKKLVDFLHDNIFRNFNSRNWQEIALTFSNNVNFVPLYFSTQNLKDIYTKRSDIMEFALRGVGNKIDYSFPERPQDRKKIRLGILKITYAPGPETFAAISVFEYLDRNKFEIILYILNPTNYPLEKYAYSCADRVVILKNKDLPEQVQMIRNDNVDILFIGSILSNAIHRILLISLHRLARVQLTFFASPVTTGIRNIDYFISGKLSEPLENYADHYREKLINLDGTGFCFSYPITHPPTVIPTRHSLGIPEDSVMFISGANLYKIIPEVRETWAKIIATVPNSVLVLLPFGPSWSNSYPEIPFTQKMQEIFHKYGIASSQLFILKSLPSRVELKELFKQGDVYLNAYPYGGSTSIIDPLEVGLPTVVQDGNSLRSRMGAALLRDLKIEELIADTEEEYIQLSISLGKDRGLRQHYREIILQKMQNKPRFLDSQYYSGQMGEVLEQLFLRHS